MEFDTPTSLHHTHHFRGPPGGFGEQGNKGIYFRGTGEQRPNFEGNRGTKAILGNREHRKQIFNFWGTGEQANLFQGNKGTGTPPGRASLSSDPTLHLISHHFCYIISDPPYMYEGHSRINDNEVISRKVLLCSVLFIMPYEDTYITYSCLKFGAFIMVRFDAMMI